MNDASAFTVAVDGLAVAVHGWPEPVPAEIDRFRAPGGAAWAVDLSAGSGAVAIDRPRRRVAAPASSPNQGLIAALCLAAEERGDSLLIHAGACASHGVGVVFVAPSGGGKSTLATWLSGRDLLSDEAVVLRRRGEDLVVFATPVRSTCPRLPIAGSARVAAVLFLAKADENRLAPLGAAGAVEAALSAVFAPPDVPAARLLAGVRRLLAGVPAYRFHFRNAKACVRPLGALFGDPA